MFASTAAAIDLCRQSSAEREREEARRILEEREQEQELREADDEKEKEEIRVLLALASEFEVPVQRAVPVGEVDDEAVARRTQAVVRRRSSESMTDEEAPAAEVIPPPMGPPTRFVRKSRPVARPDTPFRDDDNKMEPERRTLIVNSLYPSFRTTVPPVRTVRWGRKRKPEVTWDDGPKSAVGAGAGARARALAGSVAYT